jgi:hypothetical protein
MVERVSCPSRSADRSEAATGAVTYPQSRRCWRLVSAPPGIRIDRKAGEGHAFILQQTGVVKMHKHLGGWSANFDDPKAFYKVWNEDLKRQVRRAEWAEGLAIACVTGAFIAGHYYSSEIWGMFFAVVLGINGLRFAFSAIWHISDASNANYLMHQWDLNCRLRRFAMTPQQRLDALLPENQYFMTHRDV